MPKAEKNTDIIIVGGGPVGLYLAGVLLQNGVSVKVLEQKTELDRHSKSLGIHPVSMELFENAGIAVSFLNKGIKIENGLAFVNNQNIGTLSFRDCPKPFNFILALPQYQTEKILEEWVRQLNPNCLLRGAKVSEVHQTENRVQITYQSAGTLHQHEALFLVGCDGKNSTVRGLMNIEFSGKDYPDTYIMGDFSDNTGFGNDAVIVLHQAGLIESFPLPGSMRRWVVKTDRYIKNPDRNLLEKLVDQRIGHKLHQQTHSMISSFSVQHLLAERFDSGRVLLAGDAAHVVSPIGGQGMNLGWINAHRLSSVIQKALRKPQQRTELFIHYTQKGQKIAQKVARRAELNMMLGRKTRLPLLKKLAAQIIVNSPISKIAVQTFTMRGLM